MANASKTVEMVVSFEKLWNVITDYEKYPNFVEGVKSVKILSPKLLHDVKATEYKDPSKRIEYNVSLLGKEIRYILDHIEDKKTGQMSWSLIESNFFKSNEGSWKLSKLAENKLEVTYSLSLDFNIYVPGLVLNQLVKSSLPKMISGFEKQANSV